MSSYYATILTDTEKFLDGGNAMDKNVPEEIIIGVTDILSDPVPDARDVLVGLAMTYPHGFPVILKSLDADGEHRLNALNLWIVLSALFNEDPSVFLTEAESLERTGYYGTTLLELLRSSIDDDGKIEEQVLYGLVLNANKIAEEKGLDVFPNLHLA